jgi:hypothetical protein
MAVLIHLDLYIFIFFIFLLMWNVVEAGELSQLQLLMLPAVEPMSCG